MLKPKPGQMSALVKRLEPKPTRAPQEKMKIRVFICGLPSSGNRLVQRLLTAAGGECAWLCHGETSDVPRDTKDAEEIRCIFLVRSHPHRMKSCKKTSPSHIYGEPVDTERMMKMMRGAAEIEAPCRWISYESLVMDPEETKKDLLEWLGLPNIDWPEIVFDANEKYRNSTVES